MITEYMIEKTKSEMAEIRQDLLNERAKGVTLGIDFMVKAMSINNGFKEGFKEAFPDAKYVGEK